MNNTTDTAAIESLRAFAIAHGEIEFAHLCTAALAGEQWAIERVVSALKLIASRSTSLHAHVMELKRQADREYRGVVEFRRCPESYFVADTDPLTLEVIQATDCTRPDGLIARGAIEI
jgi:hypothetical protein